MTELIKHNTPLSSNKGSFVTLNCCESALSNISAFELLIVIKKASLKALE